MSDRWFVTIRFLHPPPIELRHGPRRARIAPHWIEEGGRFGYVAAHVDGGGHFVFGGVHGSKEKLAAAWRNGVDVRTVGPAGWIVDALLKQGMAEVVMKEAPSGRPET